MAIDEKVLIERLEEEKEGAKRRKAFDSEVSYSCAIKIVNKLAEEYNNDSYKGKWINTAPSSRSDNIVCSECGYNSIADYPFCPNCGRRMKEGVEAKACNDDWIPCSERLPEDFKAVFITAIALNGTSYTEIGKWKGNEWFHGATNTRIDIAEVIAWMPLPAPYMPKGE